LSLFSSKKSRTALASHNVLANVPRRPSKTSKAGLIPYIFLAPGFIIFLVMIIFPMARALQISFYHWGVFPGSTTTFVGLHQYVREFHDPVFWRALENSTFYTVFTVPFQIIFGLAAALLLVRKIPGRGLFRALFYIPVVTSWVVVSLLFKFLFSTDAGFVNWLLRSLHFASHNIGWLDTRWPSMITIGILGIWKGVGWSMLIFLAALMGVPETLTEAAAIDGAGPWRTFISVTLPSIRLTLSFVTIMLVIGSLNVFTSAYIMTGGGPQQQTEVVLSYMYHQAFVFLDFGYGSALAFTLTLIVFAISFVQMRLFRGGVSRVIR